MYINIDTFSGFLERFLIILTILSILAGILTIITKNPVISVLHLILLFGSISVYLIFIGIKFIGISYLLVYVGAVSILFLFILMLLNIRVSELISDTSNSIPLGFISIFAIYLPYSYLLPNDNYNDTLDLFYNDSHVNYVSYSNWDINLVDISDIMSLGNVMYSNYSSWLIITSLILLQAMVGSIVITIKQ